MLAKACFSRDELELYLLGRADDSLSSAIECHLDTCARCDETLSDLDAGDDTLVRTLQVKATKAPASPPAWVAAMAEVPFEAPESPQLDRIAPTEPPAELGDYELLSVLGRGGMSIVFAARHKHLGREVALKVLLPTTQQRAVSRDRFAREMRAVGGLDHASIIRATDAGECDETLYLVMERIDGVDLNCVSKAEGPLPVADACAIGIEVARGLAYAHNQGVVHRDIKPSNLMLDRNGNIKILDFGLARMQSAGCDVTLQTTMGQLLGTLDYMAPEQASGCDVDARADIYALGATLFKLLAGAPPHGRSAELPIIEFLHCLATNEASRLDEHRDQIPAEVVGLIAGMLERDPARRIASAEEVVAKLQPFSTGAQLAELAARAAEKVTSSQPQTVNSMKISLTDLWSHPSPPDDASQKQPPPPKVIGQGRRGWSGWAAYATGTVMLMGVIALTIILTLKSPNGEIRIESELDNIRVELVDEQDRVDTIAVDHGTAVTTVRAGRYRIRLDSPSDGIELTPREIIVTKGKIVIAKVTKIPAAVPPADSPNPQRHPLVAMEAQVQLAKTMDELATAKQQSKPNDRLIKSLEEKLGRLRALSRPIPTEPVYEGRTLPDWIAQMRFEQESGARKIAASNVLKLATMRPDEERIELLLEAGSRLYAWDTRTVETRLYDEVRRGADYVGASARRIAAIDRDIATDHLVRALLGDDQDRREYVLTICADLRDQIQRGEWPGISVALGALTESERGAARVSSELTNAICFPDSAQSADLLLAINLPDASATAIVSIIHAALERKLEVSRAKQIAWVAAYLDKLPSFSSQRYPADLIELWVRPTVGPLRNVNWNDVDAALQADINSALEPLLATFELRLADVAAAPHDEQCQLDAATKSIVLTRIVDALNLTGDTGQLAVQLLNRRLGQLIELRATRNEPPSQEIDTPQDVAVAITLLTGEVPDSITQLHLKETGFMADQLAAARKPLSPGERAIRIEIRYNTQFGGRLHSVNLSDWYPYELITAIHDADNQMRAENDIASQFGRASNSFFARAQPGSNWPIDARLMLCFAKTSASAAAFVDKAMSTSDITLNLRRHAEFSKAITEFMENAGSPEACELGFNLWVKTRTTDEYTARLLSWLKSGDAAHARFALAKLGSFRLHDQRLLGEWATLVADSIDRVSETGQLNSQELKTLEALGENAPRAAEHAVRYIKFWLTDPEERIRAMPTSRRGGGSPALRPCVEILLRSPEQAKQIKAEIEKAIKSPPGSIGSVQDHAMLKQLVAKFSE